MHGETVRGRGSRVIAAGGSYGQGRHLRHRRDADRLGRPPCRGLAGGVAALRPRPVVRGGSRADRQGREPAHGRAPAGGRSAAPGEGDRGVPARALQAGVSPAGEALPDSSGTPRADQGGRQEDRAGVFGQEAGAGRYKQIAGVEDLIDAETSSDDAEKSKPHPDIFEAALERLRGIEASGAIAVGDTPYDAQAAGTIGLRTIGLLCGGWPEAELRGAGCIAIYGDPADLLRHYDQSPLAG